MRLARRFAGFVLVTVVLGLVLPACISPAAAAELTPTLSLKSIGGSQNHFLRTSAIESLKKFAAPEDSRVKQE